MFEGHPVVEVLVRGVLRFSSREIQRSRLRYFLRMYVVTLLLYES